MNIYTSIFAFVWSFCDQSNLSLSAQEGSGLSSRFRSTITNILTLAGEEYTGQSVVLYLKQGVGDHNNNTRHVGLDWIFANKGCFWHIFISSQSKAIWSVS